MQSAGSGGVSVVADINAFGGGLNNLGGSVFISAPSGSISMGSINTQGINGATGGNVVLSASGNISGGSASSLSGIFTAGDAAGGAVIVSAGGAVLANTDSYGNAYNFDI